MNSQKNTTEKFKWFQLSDEQVLSGFLSVSLNRKIMDKGALSYMLKMVKHDRYIYSDMMSRAELLEALRDELNNDEQKSKLSKLTTSQWVRSIIVNELNK